MDELLIQIIKEKIYSQKGVVSHIMTPIVINVTSKSHLIDLSNDYYFLITKDATRIQPNLSAKILSTDNFFVLKTDDFAGFNMFQYACFRDYILIETTIPTTTHAVFTPFKLEFLKITPKYK